MNVQGMSACLRHLALPEEKHTIKKKKCHAKSGSKWIEQAFGKCFDTAPQADKDEFQNAASRLFT
jgi:hypothetical protein